MKSLYFIPYLAFSFLCCNAVFAQKLPPGRLAYSRETDAPTSFQPQSSRNEITQKISIQTGDADPYGVGSIDNSDGMIEGDVDAGSEDYHDAPPIQRQVAQKEQSRETQVAVHPKKSKKAQSKKAKQVKSSQKKTIKQAKNVKSTKNSKKAEVKKKQSAKQVKKSPSKKSKKKTSS